MEKVSIINNSIIVGRELLMKLDKSVSQAISLVGQFGFTILVPALLCFWVGLRLDQWLGTNFFAIIFIFIGGISGIVNIVNIASKIGNSKKDKDAGR